jgi:hypothetical protein
MAEPLREELLHILQHSLGLDEHGLYRGERDGYRNHFVTDGDSGDGRMCRELVALGLMVEHASREITGGMSTFTVTDAGRDAVAEQSPSAPKLTRSQKRYQRFLIHDNGMSFREWLRAGYDEARA